MNRPARPGVHTGRPGSLVGLAGLFGLIGVVGLACGACSSSHEQPAQADAATTTADCAVDAGYHPSTYAPDLTQTGDSGAMTFVLVSANPAPPGVYANTWTLKLLDGMGHPITDATFPNIKTWMPLHGHPSPVAPTFVSNGDGTYAVSLYLFMAGLWQVTFDAQSGSSSDSTMFTFCVGG